MSIERGGRMNHTKKKKKKINKKTLFNERHFAKVHLEERRKQTNQRQKKKN